MESAHPANLFQSDASIDIGSRRAQKATLNIGKPIYLGKKQNDAQELASGGSGADGGKQKVLAAVIDNESDSIWTAESAGVVRRVNLRNGHTTALCVGHKAPVAALALWDSPKSKRKVLFSAGWDKSIQVWDASAPVQRQQTDAASARPSPLVTIPDASTDFIKALHVYTSDDDEQLPPVLLSGGSDKLIRIWDLSTLLTSLEESPSSASPHPTPKSIGTFSDHTRAITCITSLPLSSQSAAPLLSQRIFSADSMGRIFQLRFSMDGPGGRGRLSIHRELRGPETTVSCMCAGWTSPAVDDDDEDEENNTHRPTPQAQLWTGSHDKTVQMFALNENTTSPASQPPSNSTTLGRTSKIGPTLGALPSLSPRLILPHEDYVKSLLPLHLVQQQHDDEAGSRALVVTGCADEDVRVFTVEDVYASRSEDVGVQCTKRQQGHWHEVEFLGLWKGVVEMKEPTQEEQGESMPTPMPAAPQCYIVSAGLDGSIRRWELKTLLERGSSAAAAAQPVVKPPPPSSSKGPSGMTAEEERELEELMGSDDDD